MKTTFPHRAAVTVAAVLAAVLVTGTLPGTTIIATSTFDSGNDGWKIVSTLGYEGPAQYSATGGHPGGFIWGQDPDGGAFGFGAPEKFLGDISDAYGFELTFDVASYQMPDMSTSWVGMRGVNGVELICLYNAPTSIYPAWHSRSIDMTEAAGWINVADNQPPSYQEFTSVLDNLEDMVILAEFVSGLETDISGLDNVTLVPEPGSCLLLLLGGFGWMLWGGIQTHRRA